MSVVVSCFACAIVTVLLHVAWCSNPAPESRSSLLEFYGCADGASWYNNTNWNTSANVCEWYGIECSGSVVTGINFNENVRYPLPTSCLQCLTRIPLQRIVLKKGSVFGNLPCFITEFMQLRHLDLSSNSLSDAIPTELGLLGNLDHLDLSSNSLSDAIPTELGLLGELRSLDLSSNSLYDAIPTELGLLENLHYLDLSSNSLSDVIPTELALLGQLQRLVLSSNSLSDAIPTELGLLGNLHYLDVSSNSLSDAIPTELGLLRQLWRLELSSNSLSDAIPTELGLLGNLHYLDLSANSLSGAIPTEFGLLGNLHFLDLPSNSLSDAIPTELGLLGNLNRLDLSSNSLSGAIPTELGLLGQLWHLDLSSNLLSGAIPAELGQLNSSWLLALYDNCLSSFPADLLSIPMNTLDLHSNDIHVVPSFWRNISVENLNLASNPLNTDISSLINEMEYQKTVIKSFYESDGLAYLNTELPTSKLVTLDVSNCSLSGTIPSLRNRFPHARSFDFSDNFGISGRLPVDLTNGPPLVLIVEGLNLTSSDPHSETLTLKAVDVHDNYKCPVIDYKSQGSLSAVHGLDPSYFAYRGCVCLPPLVGTPPNCHVEDNTIFVAIVSSVLTATTLAVTYFVFDYWKTRRRNIFLRKYIAGLLSDYPNLVCDGESNGSGTSKPLVNPEWDINYSELWLAKDVLAAGAKGRVRAGLWRTTPVAVKEYTADSSRRVDLKFLDDEIQIHCKLRHPNVVQLYGICSNPPCIVMELMGRGSLYAVLHDRRNFLFPVLNVCHDVAQGMACLHSSNIVHMDLKSLNVLMSSTGVCKIGDFGESRRDNETIQLTHAVGTVRWMAPEIMNCSPHDYTRASDVYSFGVVMYEVMTRNVPPKVSDRDIFWKTEPFVGCDLALVTLMRKCLDNDPKERPTFDTIVSQLKPPIQSGDGNGGHNGEREIAVVGNEVNIANNINDGNGAGLSKSTDNTMTQRVRTQESWGGHGD